MNETANFTDRVQRVVRSIPKGQTMSYGEVAAAAGSPRAARAVGMIMANNSDDSVPCHRVIKADGTVGGYNGLQTKEQGAKAKQDLLDAEKSEVAN